MGGWATGRSGEFGKETLAYSPDPLSGLAGGTSVLDEFSPESSLPSSFDTSLGGGVGGRLVTGREEFWAAKSCVNNSFIESILVSMEDFNEVNSSLVTEVDADGSPELSISVTSGAILLLGG